MSDADFAEPADAEGFEGALPDVGADRGGRQLQELCRLLDRQQIVSGCAACLFQTFATTVSRVLCVVCIAYIVRATDTNGSSNFHGSV